MSRLIVGTLVLVLTMVGSAAAQNGTGACPTTPIALVTNAAWLAFNPSADHNDGPLESPVTEYRALFFAPGVDPVAGTPTSTVLLAKPAPNAQNCIWLQRAELGAIPVGQQYVLRVVAVGPTGTSARSSSSDPFGRASTAPPAAPGQPRVTP